LAGEVGERAGGQSKLAGEGTFLAGKQIFHKKKGCDSPNLPDCTVEI
jgi:hypothetical protein